MSKARILIVDDERLNINIMVSILSEDYETIVAKSGEQAIKRVETQAPDLILLDIVMPEMDGYEVFERIRAIAGGHRIPIIFITSMRSPEEETKGLRMGAVDYITKPFTPSIVEVRVANQIEYKRNRDELEQLNLTDALTGIPNRRRFDDYMSLQRAAISRSDALLSIIMIDIDYFKAFNDLYGHSAGDSCLIDVAQALSNSVDRAVDLMARYGGEEFIAVLPATDSKGAALCAQRLCDAVSALNINHENSLAGDHVTVSIGVATLLPDQRNTTVEHLIELADQALYHAKVSGRNQFHISST